MGTWIDSTLRGWLGVNLLPPDKASGFVGLVSFAKGFPSVLLSPLSGVLVDRWGSRRVLIFSQILDTVNAAIMAYLVYSNVLTPLQLLILSFFSGISGAFYIPSRSTFIGRIVPRNLLPNALAMHAFIFNLARMLGPSLAGFIARCWGIATGFLVNAISFVPLLLIVPTIPVEYEEKVVKRRSSFFSDLREGLSFVLSNDELLWTFLSAFVYSFFGVSYSTLMQVFARNVVKTDLLGYGLIMGSMGLGALGGALLAGSMEADEVASVREEIFLFFIGLSTFGVVLWPRSAFFLSFVNGMCQVVFFNITNSRTQFLSPEDKRGRVLSIYSLVTNGGSPLGAFTLGFLGNAVGIRDSYLFIALVLLSYSLLRFFAKKTVLVSRGHRLK